MEIWPMAAADGMYSVGPEKSELCRRSVNSMRRAKGRGPTGQASQQTGQCSEANEIFFTEDF